MPASIQDVKSLCACLSLGPSHKEQDFAVAKALASLLVDERRGVVLADEVGFGKTYEALAIMSLLAERARQTKRNFDRVLVLCKSSLLEKWWDELRPTRPDRGFPRYLVGEAWHAGHPVRRLLDRMRRISHRASADELRSVQENGKLQAPEGLYIVNHDVLTERNRQSRWFLRRLYETEWDLIIVDEAHHYARWTQPAYIFAPNASMTDYEQGIGRGRFGKILALTATPFELTPHEMVQLLALVRADKADLELIEKGLDLYVRQLNGFFSLRQRSAEDPLRREAVQRLKNLRDQRVLGTPGIECGLQYLLRRYMIRNTKSQNERRYFLINKSNGSYSTLPFGKLEDLHRKLKEAPLLPFDGADALFYLELRELMDETIKRARAGTDHRTFVTTDLRQGLSSYPQLLQSALLARDLEGARRLKGLVDSWTARRRPRLHPKVAALADVVEEVAKQEIAKVRRESSRWFSKVLVFNKLIGGTAPHLREVLTARLEPIFQLELELRLGETGAGTPKQFAASVRSCINKSLSEIKARMKGWREERCCLVPDEFRHESFIEHRGRHLVDAYKATLVRRAEQPLLLLHAALHAGGHTADAIAAWVEKELTGAFEPALRRIVDTYLDEKPAEERPRYELLETAERECVALMEECTAVEIVGRYDGANVRYREAHRRNFNQPFNPFVLLVSRVGEEGIDLQQQCRYVIHYDLEWNPAKMEQREGRVDRVGWGRADEGYIDVRFMLLKGTYEERIFHAVMQRDQWFQVLIGSKRKELGVADDDEAAMKPVDIDDGPVEIAAETGRLSHEEMSAIMIDLRPRPV